jgi:hypothetical protein
LVDKERPLNRDITIERSELKNAYTDMMKNAPKPEVIDGDEDYEE